MKVVLDTNVLISALLFRKQLGEFFDLIAEQKIIPCFSATTFFEFREVIQRQKFIPILDKLNLSSKEIIQAVTDKSLIIPDSKKTPQIITHIPDNFIISCAVEVNADFIVSGDQHLLKLKSFHDIPIGKIIKNMVIYNR